MLDDQMKTGFMDRSATLRANMRQGTIRDETATLTENDEELEPGMEDRD